MVVALLIGGTFTMQAQYETLVLNYEKSCFGENEPLPAGKNFIITGVVNNNIEYVAVDIYSKKGIEKDEAIYGTFWKRDLNSESLNFSVPINYTLKEGREYDLLIQYFRRTTDKERAALRTHLHSTLDAYVNQAFKISDKELGLVNNTKQTMSDLNTIVKAGLTKYRTRTMMKFESFSDIVKLKLEQMDDLKLKKGTSGENNKNERLAFKKQMLTELQNMLHTELEQYLTSDLYIMVDDKYIDDYPTDKLQSYLPINVGYGGAMFNYDFDNFNYGDAPYLGISIPFGREANNSAFWSRSSLSVGVFLTNIEDQDQVEYSGPIVQIPFYAALGYRAYRFVRINAGAAFLENTADNSVEIVPFIGLSAEFNVSVKLAK